MENKNQAPHIGEILKTYRKQKRIYQSGMSRALNVYYSTVNRYFKKPSMQTTTLWNVCHVLKHNFFADLAAMLPPEFSHGTNTADEKIAALEKEIEKLKIENEVLREIR